MNTIIITIYVIGLYWRLIQVSSSYAPIKDYAHFAALILLWPFWFLLWIIKFVITNPKFVVDIFKHSFYKTKTFFD